MFCYCGLVVFEHFCSRLTSISAFSHSLHAFFFLSFYSSSFLSLLTPFCITFFALSEIKEGRVMTGIPIVLRNSTFLDSQHMREYHVILPGIPRFLQNLQLLLHLIEKFEDLGTTCA